MSPLCLYVMPISLRQYYHVETLLINVLLMKSRPNMWSDIAECVAIIVTTPAN